jgi:hypothetical protein
LAEADLAPIPVKRSSVKESIGPERWIWIRGWQVAIAVVLLSWLYVSYAAVLLDHGTTLFLYPIYLRFLAVYGLLGGLATVLLALGLARLGDGRVMERCYAVLIAVPERLWLASVASAAMVLPILWRRYALLGMPLTDDEAVYRFTSELLASGRLYASSHPLKLFFDQSFMINDGRYYGQYFIGWPLLLAPFRALGIPAAANGLCHAAGLLGVYAALRLQLGSVWAKVGSLLFVCAPLLFLNAATLLSHTSCVAALAWCAYCMLRASSAEPEGSSRAFWSALMTLCFCVAFFVRPQSALPVGGPLLGWWLVATWRSPRPRRWIPVASFLAVALPMAGLFLGVNRALTGSMLVSPYQQVRAYAESNDYRFTHFARRDGVPDTNFGDFEAAARQMSAGLFRFNFAAFGWPSSFVLALFALRSRAARVWWLSLGVAMGLFFFLHDPGVDIIGPVHLTEVLLPLVALSTIGLRDLQASTGRGARFLLGAPAGARPEGSVLAVLAALLLASWVAYWPVRGRSQHHVARATALSYELPEREAVRRAVLFASRDFVPPCLTTPSWPMVVWWPVNDPDFRNPVIYANHISVEDDRRLVAEHFPDRDGFVVVLDPSCRLQLVPLSGYP